MNGSSDLLSVYFSKRDSIERFLVARLGSRDEAEDVLQELYLKLNRLELQGEVRDPVAYLFRSALNLARDRRRERQRARTREADWVEHSAPGRVEAPQVEAALAARQRLQAIRGALDELSPQCRRVFLLHKFEGLSHEEVARQAGISRSTVEKHMHTALRHLIARLGRD